MAIGDESFDELDEADDLPSYDELFEAFKELYSDTKKLDWKMHLLKRKF